MFKSSRLLFITICLFIFISKNNTVNAQVSVRTVENIAEFKELYFTNFQKRFPIEKPYPLDRTLFECYTDSSRDYLRDNNIDYPSIFPEKSHFNQGSNGVSYCSGQPNYQLCTGVSDINMFTNTGGICYYRATNTFRLANNVINQSENGCFIEKDQQNINNPGGYANYLILNNVKNINFWDSDFFNLSKLDQLKFSTTIDNNIYEQNICPETASKFNDPVAQINLSLIFNKKVLDPNGKPYSNESFFYQIGLFDNRDNQDFSFIDCNFATSVPGKKFYLAQDNVGYYNYNFATIQQSTKYLIDAYPRIVESIKTCDPDTDMSNWYFTKAFIGSELMNATYLVSTFQNPKITMVTEPKTSQYAPIYSMYCDKNLEHVYVLEKDKGGLLSLGCKDEGVFGYVSTVNTYGLLPLNHLWSAKYKKNIYTISPEETRLLISQGWQKIDVLGYLPNIQEPLTKQFYRLRNPNSLDNSEHLLTFDNGQIKYYQDKGYILEGKAGYIYVPEIANYISGYTSEGEPVYEITDIRGDIDGNNLLQINDLTEVTRELFSTNTDVNNNYDVDNSGKFDFMDVFTMGNRVLW